ncbi:hypothetical protein [Francisella halioticida]|uniref:hypothetical protein n=1 Tax=Francisella halioticida TaxID=549298 RepID=UPI0012FA2819|nr:hypothetical protein [Francisella halioticida]
MSLKTKGYGLVKVVVIITIISILITIGNNEYSSYINKTNLTTDALYGTFDVWALNKL